MNPELIQELRKARTEKNITLQEISRATRINVRFLDAIEQGNFEILPQPYVKSFVKQYARYVGLDETGIMARFEETKKQSQPETEPGHEAPATFKPSSEAMNTPKIRMMFLSLAVIGGMALLVYFVITSIGTSEEPVAERPFQDVVREIEEHAERTEIAPVDSPIFTDHELRDSVSLAVTAIDTVWLTITVDNILQEEYIFPPGRSREWKAANDFLLTVGNAGGVNITVNEDSIGVLGSTGQVLRNLHITRDGIQR